MQYLKNNTYNQEVIIEENKFLKALNNIVCLSGDCGYNFTPPEQIMIDDNLDYPNMVETRIFAGVGNKTIETIFIKDDSNLNDVFYPDGEPIGIPRYDEYDKNNLLKPGSDGTVLLKSTKLVGLLRILIS